MPHVLPPLPYSTDALEPFYDQETLRLHHGTYHAGYVEKLNRILETVPSLADKSVEELLLDPSALPRPVRQAIINNGGGHANHSLLWRVMGPGKGGEPQGRIAEALRYEFGSVTVFKKKFSAMAMDLFGSGWTFLTQAQDGELGILNLTNQDSPISRRQKPILVLDLWEHAYFLKWKNKKKDWIETFWDLVDWGRVETLYMEEPAWMMEYSGF